ncbi:MAG: hypothetical protein ACPKQO_00015 [Nitrososphaeraceae archaeon]
MNSNKHTNISSIMSYSDTGTFFSPALFFIINRPVSAEFGNKAEYKFMKKWRCVVENDGQYHRHDDLDFGIGEEILYVEDLSRNRVQAFGREGNFLFKCDLLRQKDDQFNKPYGLDVDMESIIWIPDGKNDNIQKFGPVINNKVYN